LNGLNREWPDWIISALEAARMAPSAVNRQPWRFSVEEDDSIKISVDSFRDPYRISKRLDCGIAMVHIEVGAGHIGRKAGNISPYGRVHFLIALIMKQ